MQRHFDVLICFSIRAESHIKVALRSVYFSSSLGDQGGSLIAFVYSFNCFRGKLCVAGLKGRSRAQSSPVPMASPFASPDKP
jgi:hypothetical protein